MQIIRNSLGGGFLSRQSKSNEKSKFLRYQANVEFTNQSNGEALNLYNQAICFAEPDSEELHIAYANRSAVYFRMKLYYDCIKNIELALTRNCLPQFIQQQLIERRNEAHIEANRQEGDCAERSTTEPKILLPTKPGLPSIATCLEAVENEQKVRFLITTRDLAVGDVIAFEKSYCTVLAPNYRYSRCDHCCLESAQNLMPCNACTSVMYCSEACRDAAYHQYHRYECLAIDLIHAIKSSDDLSNPSAMHLALRTAFCALSEFGDMDALKHFIENAEKNFYCLFDMSDRSVQLNSQSDYGYVYNMQRIDPNQQTIKEVNTYLRFICKTILDNSNRHDIPLDTLIKLIKRHYHAAIINQIHLENMPHLHKPHANIGMFPFRSLIQHSCMPNLTFVARGNELVFVVIKPISEGEKLTACFR